jgi:4'-phosphopantetheinyl transferase
MPLLFSKKINPYSAYAVWKITETEAHLLDLCHTKPPEMQSAKRLEWMVSRILVKYLCELCNLTFNGITNLPTGRPVLINNQAEISITHSFSFAATLINLRKKCGIDIELERQKMLRVQHKFLHNDEQQYQDNLEILTKIWSAKEVIFKVHGRKNLSFKDEVSLKFDSENNATGRILKSQFEMDIPIRYERVLDYWLCYSI